MKLLPILFCLIAPVIGQQQQDIKSIQDELDAAIARIEEAQRLLRELENPTPPVPVPDDDIFQMLSNLPFADQLPAPPQYSIPTEADCEWIIEGGVATSTRGLPPISGEFVIGPAYRASRAAGHQLPIDFGIRDNGSTAAFGGGWSQPKAWNDRSVFVQDANGEFENIRCRILGLDDECEVQVSWDTKWGYVEELGLFNIGLRGPNSTFIIVANNGIGELTIDGCWFLTSEGFSPGQHHASAIHIDNWQRLILRRTKWRGVTPSSPGINLREHLFYLKSSLGETWILENNLMGGNRTGFQIRPENPADERPVGPVVIAGNFAHGYGWNMGEGPRSFDGGSCITVWTNPESRTFIIGNEITDAKYGCLMVGGQDPSRNWLNDSGFPINNVWVWNNKFENSQDGHQNGLPKRSTVSITAVEVLHWGPNEFDMLTLNNQWGMQHHGIANGLVKLYDRSILREEVWTFDGVKRRMTTEELFQLLVN